ncbi:Protein of unknown function [Psychrobacillus sp. OK028]|uniref:DUF3139 domain-containing protein n=1 Tax=Psychrobacillus sp. OK028 TaxID=1884359 RepID=UPI00087E4FD3|nr:DUF3139 domain-containing protein [Psychrobacillus sp. OK028]SDM89836.1 Protein of unknown function [Psychrobacillus sp. OK028]
MRKKKTITILTILVFILIGSVSNWYVNFPAYEKLAEERIDTYMAAQGIDKNKVSKKYSHKNYEQGRWSIYYEFDEEGISYHYEYDKSSDSILLLIRYRGVPIEIIKKDVKYPAFDKGWTAFDESGNIVLK